MRELGFPLDDVRELLGLVDGGDYACADIHAMAHGRLGEVRRKIADLQRIEAVLLEMMARCERGETPECPIVDALFNG
jgi:MerR family mercuric resistance operon transcriptional regulator